MTEKDLGQQADGPANVFLHPPDLLQFVSTEHQHFLTSLVTCHEEIKILSHVHGLYAAAMTNQTTDESTVVIFQLLAFVHYHFLFASSSYMRCHMAEGFSSARAAIDGALIASQIIHDRASQVAYIERSKPFDKLIRHFKNLTRDKKPLPHPLIEHLIQQHDSCSQFASHADVQTFAHRLEFLSKPYAMMSMGYFQFPHDPPKMKHHFLGLLHIFVVTLDIFSGFMVDEKKCLPEQWRQELHHVGRQIEDRRKQLLPDTTGVT
jgi:hypothetical protein